MICISWFLKFRGERAANYFVSSIASRKNGGKFMAPTKLAFLLLEKDEGGDRVIQTETVRGLEVVRGKTAADTILDTKAIQPTTQNPFVSNILGYQFEYQFVLLKPAFDDFRCLPVAWCLNNTKTHFNLSLLVDVKKT
jgi:hypothetical protein